MFFTLLTSLFLNTAIINYDPVLDNNDKNPIIANIIHKKWIEIIKWADRSTDYPKWAKPDLNYKHEDLSYWVQEVLPYKEDRERNAYIVYPKMWVILPVEEISGKDKSLIRAKQWFDHYKYLVNWSLHYLWNSPSKWKGNMVIAAHSAYYAKDDGRYKTAFQAVVLSDIWDRIWYFEKDIDWTYVRYDYAIEESKQVRTNDTSILFPTIDWRQLTTYTCYPFGSVANRRYNKSNLVGKSRWFSAEKSKEAYSTTYTYHSIASLPKYLWVSYTPRINSEILNNQKNEENEQKRQLHFWKSKTKVEKRALDTVQIALNTMRTTQNQ